MIRNRTAMGAALLLAASLLAGCAEPELADEPGVFMLSGSFEAGAAGEDVEDFRNVVRSFDGEPVVIETEPIQFQARGMDESRCENLRLKLESLGYVAEVSDCQEQLTDDVQPTGGSPTPS